MIHGVDLSGVKIDFCLVRQVKAENGNELVKIGFWLVWQRSV